MTPTQLTVLTRASTSAFRMSPCAFSMAAIPPSGLIVPLSLNRNRCFVFLGIDHGFGLRCDFCIEGTYSANKLPRERIHDQELRLLAFLHLSSAKIRCGDRRPIDDV